MSDFSHGLFARQVPCETVARTAVQKLLSFWTTPRCPASELVVVKLDRLGRSTRDVLNLVHDLEVKGAPLTVLDPPFSTKDAAGPILVTVLGMVAERERRFIRERQQARIEGAKAKGIYKGREPSVPVEKVREMRATGQGPTAIVKALGISRVSVHRVLTGA